MNELDDISHSDYLEIDYFKDYVEAMNRAVEQIGQQLDQDNVEEAIRVKLAFEAQISPSLKRSNEELERMTDRVQAVGTPIEGGG